LLSKERLQKYCIKLKEDKERLLFELESFGSDEDATAEALLKSVERAQLEEEMKALRERLYREAGTETLLIVSGW